MLIPFRPGNPGLFGALLQPLAPQKKLQQVLMKKLILENGAKACKSCRSRQELSNEYLLAKFGVDTEENEPYKVCSCG